MSKIIVTTDFSKNSKKAIRFALQYASQTNSELIFYTVVGLTIPPANSWDLIYYDQLQKAKLKRNQERLEKFIQSFFIDKAASDINYRCVSELGNSVGNLIVAFAEKNNADFICTSSAGKSNIGKLLGTVATFLISHAPMPVFIIPKSYRRKEIQSICYASDLTKFDAEIKKVLPIAKSLNSKLKVLHYDYATHFDRKSKKIISLGKKYAIEKSSFFHKKLNPLYPLYDHLRKDSLLSRSSLVILFTKQNRRWYDRLMTTSQSTDLSFTTKVPLLIFKK